jgi:hypothetical protein
MHRVRALFASVTVLVALALSGCSGGKVKVNGVVLLDGKPVEGATVTFLPVNTDKGKMAFGSTDKEGNFQLTTKTNNDGAFPGEYKVTVVYAEGAEPPAAGGMKEAMEGFEKAQRQKRAPPKYIVPAKYSDPDQSGFKFKVPTGGMVTLDLKSKG